ncbi:hypothetical protein FE257_002183 [Aspergillus nanangensis]|uniref:Uncharacterized protein n=1 Tax=Aspergillus nanangensis TaxID=2582783 RepID=A0AAD4CEE4_ASPNN|nr:hypothetical protein FE257_002183 [Aspergillus nanangensis]
MTTASPGTAYSTGNRRAAAWIYLILGRPLTSYESRMGDGAANACASLEDYREDHSSLGGHEALGLYVGADHVARITSCRSSHLDCWVPVPMDTPVKSNQSQSPRASRPSQTDSDIMNNQGLSGDE